VNCGPRSYLHHIAITCLLFHTVYFTRILLLFSTRYTHNLCFKQTGEIDNLIVSWEESICLCVCRFHVAAKHHLQSSLSLLSWSINLGILTEGKLAATLIIHSSWGSQRAGHSPRTRTNCSHVNYTPPALFWRHHRVAVIHHAQGIFWCHQPRASSRQWDRTDGVPASPKEECGGCRMQVTRRGPLVLYL
jgi:hypothetical protein